MSFSKKAKARHYLAFIGFFFSPLSASRKCDICDWNLNRNPPPLRNLSHWLISSKLDRVTEVLKVVGSYKFYEKQHLDRRERSKLRFPILFGLLFGRSTRPAGWQGIRWMLPNQAKLALSPKQLIVKRCGKQFLKSEMKFLLKTGLPSVVDLFMCLWLVKASPQVCSFIWLWNILLFHACSCDPCTYSYLLCRQWLPGYLQFLHQKALMTDQWRIISLLFISVVSVFRHFKMFKSV